MAPNCHSARGVSMVLGEATLVTVTSAPPSECCRCQRAERRFRRGIPRSSFEELLAAVDVEGGAGDSGCDTRSHVVSELVEEVWLMPET